MPFDQTTMGAMEWRCIGPPRGGRVVAVAGDPSDPAVFYFGACAGGVWKTTDGGTFWENVSDGFFETAAVGAIAVSESDPNVVYGGMGESCTRNDVSHGDGVYKSNDGGRTWTNCGLEATRHISRVRIHPADPDVVFVAALGDIFGTNPERGVYKSTDGGRTWRLVLHRSDKAGAADLVLDPQNPRTLYATIWEARRYPWEMSSGGADSSLYRSTDGGETWDEITRRPGFPRKALLGRMGVAVAPRKPGRVWALIEAAEDEGGLYRSEDHGESWERVSEDRALLGRPWYYSHIVADPSDPDTIYGLNLGFWKSSDGGRHFRVITTPHGDNHDVWIDPHDSRRMIEGNDGGACVSYNGGETFSTIYNQPTGQFYHVVCDDEFPYAVYGTQQDNSAIRVPSRSRKGAIVWKDCEYVGHSESGHIAVDRRDSRFVFSGAVGSSPGGGGALLRYDRLTEQVQLVTVNPEYFFGEGPGSQEHRFQWTFPITFSSHDPSVLYVTGERVFRSRDDGMSWDAISTDLTRNDASKLGPSGGPITKDTSGAEHYCTVYAFCESPHERGVLWAGSDDGLVHVSRDDGSSWTNVTPPGLPEWATVTVIEPSSFDAATFYVAAVRYKLQDRAAYVFRTTDYGAKWERITGGIPEGEFIRIVRSDPLRPGLLYAGSETRPYVSFDDGGSWQELTLGMPRVPIYDMQVKNNDLVVASHGRGFWILDDLTPIREWSPDPGVRVHAPPVVHRYLVGAGGGTVNQKSYMMAGSGGSAFVTRQTPDGERKRVMLNAGTNPRSGATLRYWLDERPKVEDLELALIDASGNELVSFTPDPLDEQEDETPAGREVKAEDEVAETAPEAAGEEEEGGTAEVRATPPKPKRKPWPERLPRKPGLNRFTWDMRAKGHKTVPNEKGETDTPAGPRVPPGRYTARLRVGDLLLDRTFEIKPDPRIRAGAEDLEAQYALLCAIRDKQSECNAAIGRIRKIRGQVDSWSSRTSDNTDEIKELAKAASKALTAVEDQLTNTNVKHDTDRLKLPAGLDRKLAELPAVIGGADARPTKQARAVFEKIAGRVDESLSELERVVAVDVAALNDAIGRAAVAVVDTSVAAEEEKEPAKA